MRRYALFLRGVNVGTKNSLPMADLRAQLEGLGCTDVRTYVQSGNAVFATDRAAEDLARAIEGALERRMGRPIGTTLRTAKQLKAVLEGNPFAEEAAADPAHLSHLCVTFLSRAPSPPELAPLHAKDFAPERFRVSGAEIYSWHPQGLARSALSATLAKLKLRGTMTMRNWNTVRKLSEMLDEG